MKAFCKSVMDRMLAPEEGEAESKISRMFKDIGGALDQHALTEIMRELHRGFQGQGFINPNSVFDKSWVTYILSKHDTGEWKKKKKHAKFESDLLN